MNLDFKGYWENVKMAFFILIGIAVVQGILTILSYMLGPAGMAMLAISGIIGLAGLVVYVWQGYKLKKKGLVWTDNAINGAFLGLLVAAIGGIISIFATIVGLFLSASFGMTMVLTLIVGYIIGLIISPIIAAVLDLIGHFIAKYI